MSVWQNVRERARRVGDEEEPGLTFRDDPYRKVDDKEAKQLAARSDEMIAGMKRQSAGPTAVARAQAKNSNVSDAEANRLMARSDEMMGKVSDKDARQLSSRADEMIAGTKQRLKERKNSLIQREDPYSDTRQEEADKKAALDDAIGARVAEDRPAPPPAKPEDQRSAAVNRYAGQMFGVGSAPKGYAQLRKGQEGGLFGEDPHLDLAPGTEDSIQRYGMRDPYSREIAGMRPLPKFRKPGQREIATSDDRAKLDAAYERGKQDASKVAKTPSSGVRKLSVTSGARGKDQLSVQHSAYDAEQNDALDAQHAAFDAEQKKNDESARVAAAADRAAPQNSRKVLPSGEVVEGRRLVSTSGADAKREAFLDGVQHNQRMHDTGMVPEPPSYMPNTPKNAGASRLEVTKPPTGAAKSMSRPKGEETPRAQLEEETDTQKGVSRTGNATVIGAKSAMTPARGKATPEQVAAMRKFDAAGRGGHSVSKAGQEGYEEEVALSDEQTKDMQSEADQFFGRGGTVQKPEGPPIKEGGSGSSERFGVSSDMDGPKGGSISGGRKGAVLSSAGGDGGGDTVSKWNGLAKEATEKATGQTTSDEDSKRGKRDADPMSSANRSMKPKVYTYKEGFAEHEGQTPDEVNVGPIAQNMKRDPVASTAIVEDKKTGLLGIDKSKGLKLVMGSVADLQEQIDELKGRKVRRGKYA